LARRERAVALGESLKTNDTVDLKERALTATQTLPHANDALEEARQKAADARKVVNELASEKSLFGNDDDDDDDDEEDLDDDDNDDLFGEKAESKTELAQKKQGESHSIFACLDEYENTSHNKLTLFHSILLTRFTHFALTSLKMRTISLRSAQN